MTSIENADACACEGISVGEYNRPGSTLDPTEFAPDQYHLYELVYDPRSAGSATVAQHGITCNRCTATMYVDGVNTGVYYPYYSGQYVCHSDSALCP